MPTSQNDTGGSYVMGEPFLEYGMVAASLPTEVTAGRARSGQTKRISIRFNSDATGEGTLNCHGLGEFKCLGNPTIGYCRDLTVKGEMGIDKFRQKESTEYPGAIMPFAILIMGNRGIYIHEMPATLAENGGPSAGCIHVGHGDAEKVYDFVTGKTRITISYPWSTPEDCA